MQKGKKRLVPTKKPVEAKINKVNTIAEPVEDAKIPIREAVREPIRELRKGEFHGRNGEILTRHRETAYNPYDFPDEIKEDGWSYQWIRTGVYGNTEMSELSAMMRGGWRPVRPDMLKRYFYDENKDRDTIERDGLILVERPAAMTEEARRETQDEANRAFARQLEKRWQDDTPLPPGMEPLLREVEVGHYEEVPEYFKPAHKQIVHT